MQMPSSWAADSAAQAGGQTEGQRDLQNMSPEELANSFLGDWRDQRNRWWFAVDEITGNANDGFEVSAARFRLASLKEGHIDGDYLRLVSRSCVGIFGCYEYYIDLKLIAPNQLDMTATTDTCTFEPRCMTEGEVAHFTMTRE
jgi:hypothetical protein